METGGTNCEKGTLMAAGHETVLTTNLRIQYSIETM